RSLAEMDKYLCQRIIILYAGALSEPISSGSPTKTIGDREVEKAIEVIHNPKSGAASDHVKIQDLRAALRNIRFPDTDPGDTGKIERELYMLDKDLWGRTISLINRHYETI